jgi:hypothetical protein
LLKKGTIEEQKILLDAVHRIVFEALAGLKVTHSTPLNELQALPRDNKRQT